MKTISKQLKNISPFNDREEMPAAVYAGKKILAFFLIYVLSGIASQVLMLGVMFCMGYNPIQGISPSEQIQMIIYYYGFAAYILVAVLYCKIVEKRGMKEIGFGRKIGDHTKGAGLAVILLTAVTVICCIVRGITFSGLNTGLDIVYLIALFGGFLIQGAAEELMCRGFLLQTLARKMTPAWAIFLSATMFAFPHFESLFAGEFMLAAIGIVNLYLISVIFSVLTLRCRNIWAACGLHSVWNFLLNGVMGLAVSGNEAGATGIFCFTANGSSILNGGSYGLESSLVTTVVLGAAAVLICRKSKAEIHMS